MTKVWYPVIDYMVCTECGTCVTKCPYGVYDIKKAPSPVVKNPEACIEHCHG
ncbi:MAG: 4Fe-4S dicluster domain-containing protein, partial [Actinomycetota bacterium]|nr:4Fe-4S dicluster domain-containing protein [Actinomycetota bacterium]